MQDVIGHFDLSRIRHELRTPINHILGYCELLLEDEQVPPAFIDDIRRIHSGGRRLQALIQEYFAEEKFFLPHDMRKLYHELRTPVNQIVGYCELLEEQALELKKPDFIADLRKIRAAAAQWMALAEAHLVEVRTPAVSEATVSASAPSSFTGTVLVGSSPNALNSSGFQSQAPACGAVLVVDDDAQNRDVLARRLRRIGYTVSEAADGSVALRSLRVQEFDLILLDMIMPGLDGFQVLTTLKSEPSLREIPVIMLSALDEENGIARCIELGAEDYLSKPFNAVFLWARIGAVLERKRLRDSQRAAFAALQASQQQLAAELAEAAAYVRSLLPPPLCGAIQAEWCFHPGAQLGGDAFGYHWIDENHFAIYLLDVCGHGVGAALLSVSALNALRAQTLPGVDFRNPAEVLTALNSAFPMERQNQLYFTIWMGVYRPRERELTYASGGHPPALLLSPLHSHPPASKALRTPCPPIGCFEDARFTASVQPVQKGTRLIVSSDGVFEIRRADGRTGTWPEFSESFRSPQVASWNPLERLQHALHEGGSERLEDDFSLMDIRFD